MCNVIVSASGTRARWQIFDSSLSETSHRTRAAKASPSPVQILLLGHSHTFSFSIFATLYLGVSLDQKDCHAGKARAQVSRTV